MYLSHFGLAKKPFEISPDPDFLWLGEKHREGLSILKYGILENKGFLLITGEVGTGKTALIRAIEKDIKARAIIVTIPDPGMSLMDFYNYLAAELNMERHFKNKGEFLIQFKKFILNAFSSYLRVLLIIDESQRLNHDLLEEIRLLSNIDLNGKVLINIFFVGQNEFRNIITREENRAVRQRITVSYHLTPLTEDENAHYIRHRLKVAGTSQEIFTPDALKAVHGFSKGLPRLTNIVCDNALMTAYVRGQKQVDADIVRECGDDLRITIGESPPLEKEKQPPPVAQKKTAKPPVPVKADQPHSARGVVIFASFLLLLLAGWYFYGDRISDQLENWGNQREPRQTQGSAAGGNSRHIASAPPLPVETGPRQPQPTEAPDAAAKKAAAAAPPAAAAAAPKPAAPEPPPAPKPAKIEPSPVPPSPAVALKPAAPPTSSEPVSSPAPAAPAPAAETFKLKDFAVFFGPNSVEVSAGSTDVLAKVAGLLKATPGAVAIIEGHSDSTGDAGYNRLISENRAVSVRNYLIGRGIESSRFTVAGFGSSKPIDTNETPEGRSKNRRVVIRIIPSRQG